jgi:hypothetical protein
MEAGNSDIVKHLIDMGLKLDKNFLNRAIGTGNINIVKAVIGMDTKTKPDKDSLNRAIGTGNIDIVKAVIDMGAEPDMDYLKYAIRTGKMDILTTVIGMGAIPDVDFLRIAHRMNNTFIYNIVSFYYNFYRISHEDNKYKANIQNHCKWILREKLNLFKKQDFKNLTDIISNPKNKSVLNYNDVYDISDDGAKKTLHEIYKEIQRDLQVLQLILVCLLSFQILLWLIIWDPLIRVQRYLQVLQLILVCLQSFQILLWLIIREPLIRVEDIIKYI